jgi:peptidoglycan/xylan/chitin deacetylase (PgdA/CDA1 family)
MTKHQKNIAVTIVLICMVVLCKPAYYMVLVFLILVVFLSGLLHGIFSLNSGYFMNSLCKSPLKKCILSFDDGPSEYTLGVLEVLRKYEISAVFFVIGNQLALHPEITNEIVKQGHLLGNHSYSHSNKFAFMSTKKVLIELQKTENLLGVNSLKLFRSPVGISNPNIARAVDKLNLKSVGWSLRSFDTQSGNSSILAEAMLGELENNSLILLHDNLQNSVDNLELFLVQAKENGFRFTNSKELNSVFNV